VKKIFGMQLVTPQTGPQGKKVQSMLVEQGLAIEHEYYLGMLLDRGTGRVTAMASAEGGMDIEEVAAKHPEKIFKHAIDPALGWQDWQSRALAKQLGLSGKTAGELGKFLKALARCYEDMDCSMLEINPLVTTKDGRVLALDAKINFDDNALFAIEPRVAIEREDAAEQGPKWDLSYISLEATSAAWSAPGSRCRRWTSSSTTAAPNFLDVGGGATAEDTWRSIITTNPDVKAIFVNIFGGIMKCGVAAGVMRPSGSPGSRSRSSCGSRHQRRLGKKMLAGGLASPPASDMAVARR
jgi:succinyl-CoA synthetase beta subunit